MKRAAVLFLLLTCSVYAQTFYMNVWSKGKGTSIPINEIKKIAFTSVMGVGETAKEQILVKTFELFQNYPNPFNPTTRIEYQIPASGYVEIQLFNVTGELVRTLTRTEQAAGKYSVSWNGRDNYNRQAASGIYIYRVMFGGSALSRKMLLLK